MNPDQTAPKQSDLGPYRLQYRSQTLINNPITLANIMTVMRLLIGLI